MALPDVTISFEATMKDDPYSALGLEKTASEAEIKKAYRKIARTCHPDLNPEDKNAEARFKAASAAYDLLKDPEVRGRYDRGEIDASGAERQERQFYREYAENPDSPYGRGQRFEDAFGQSGNSAEFFAEYLRQQGQGGAGQQGFSAPGPDRRYSLEVSFLDAAKGAKTRITLPDGGSLEVIIPQGTADGQTLRLRGKGGAGFGGGPQGNALVTLSVQPHKLFRREGNDIVISLPISIDEAVLGGKVEVPTIEGAVKLTIPRGANGGQVLRLRGRGVKPTGAAKRGDQRVELQIETPPEIDEELAKFMEGWRETNGYDPRQGMKE
jgi:DnaJ-class molecular chaperone